MHESELNKVLSRKQVQEVYTSTSFLHDTEASVNSVMNQKLLLSLAYSVVGKYDHHFHIDEIN